MNNRPTLPQAFAATFVVLTLVLVGLLAVFYAGSRRTLLLASERLMAQSSRRLTNVIEDHLAEAERVVASVEAKVSLGLFDTTDPETAAAALRLELAGRPQIGALSLTHGLVAGVYDKAKGDQEPGDVELRREGRWQARALRTANDVSVMITLATDKVDPTQHPTFTTPVRQEFHGRALWSDLSVSQDAPVHRVVTVQKALWPANNASVSVLRVTLQSDRIDDLVKMGAADGHTVFLADDHGQLVSRLSPSDRFEVRNDEVRVAPARWPAGVAEALASPLFATLAPGQTSVTTLESNGARSLLSVTALPDGRTVGWLVGIVAPESLFLADLQQWVLRVLALAGALVLLCVAGGALIMRATRRDLGELIRETTRLRHFDFAPAPESAPVFRDVRLASDALEQAKVALRALGKYAPLDLVRQLYEARQEPMLGGRVQDVSLLFSDIESFTSVSESLPLDVLATALGHYLQAMTEAVHASHGIIDKFTGDGVMAIWNAPTPCEGHAVRACEAVWACMAATQRLFASDVWTLAKLSPWRTRFGVHRADVSVGHFGAPDRMSFTAMGDGVNLASRLEGLNKQYGTFAMVSATIEREARHAFHFRRLDRVAVKGKTEGIDVYELLGPRNTVVPSGDVEKYESALGHYLARHFAEALTLLTSLPQDAPARVLAARCEHYLVDPPPADWNGVFVAQEK